MPDPADTTPRCDPQVMPYADVADRWVCRCPCGHNTEWATEAEAQTDRDQHAHPAPTTEEGQP